MQEVTARIGDQGRLRMGVERATNVVHTGHNTAGGPEPARRDLPPVFLPTPNRIADTHQAARGDGPDHDRKIWQCPAGDVVGRQEIRTETETPHALHIRHRADGR
jgi:hypothetical protein